MLLFVYDNNWIIGRTEGLATCPALPTSALKSDDVLEPMLTTRFQLFTFTFFGQPLLLYN